MTAPPPVDVVLVRPEHPANVGAVARAMRNTALGRLVLVAAGDFRTIECWRSAWGAHNVLEAAVETPDLAAALQPYEQAAGFSGRSTAAHPAIDVRALALRVAARGDAVRAAFVFGRETAGLSEEELRLCGLRALIPAHPDQPSLNLSHAVLVAGYELFRASVTQQAKDTDARAGRAEREAFLQAWRPALVAAGALAEGDRRYFARWEALFRRADLTSRDLRLFEHLAHKLSPPDRR